MVVVVAHPLEQHRSGFFTPDDLRMLEVVLGVLLQRDGLDATDPQANALARRLFEAFEHGARDEVSLLKAVGRWGASETAG